MKKLLTLTLCALFTLGAVTSCGKSDSKADSDKSASKSDSAKS